MAKQPQVGTEAPDFTLPGVVLRDGEFQTGDYTLSAHRGRPLVLAFYPGDDTAVCTRQLCEYSAGLEQFAGLGADVWGISPQGLDSHRDFAGKHGLRMPLLADTEQVATEAYGIGLLGSLRRAVFVLDAEGVVRWRHVAVVGLTFQDLETITRELKALQD